MGGYIQGGVEFWVAQGCAALAMGILYVRMGLSDRKKFNLYHTYLCVPMVLHWLLLGSGMVAALCFIGGVRTLLLATDLGWKHRVWVIAMGVVAPLGVGIFTAQGWFDWFLLSVTLWAVASEGMKSFFHLRAASFAATAAWLAGSVVMGGYVSAAGHAAALYSCGASMDHDYRILNRLRALCGCEKSRLSLAQAA